MTAHDEASGEDGPARLLLHAPDGGRVEIHRHGAHVTRWTDASGDEVLYLSPRSGFGAGDAIRGGIPVIFPQFADAGPLPRHGFARTAEWRVLESSATHAALVLTDTPETRAVWDHAFRAELRVAVDGSLSVSLAVENTGERAFEFTAALHTYFRVGDVRQAELRGLDGVWFRDKVEGGERVQLGDRLRFTREIDRVYASAPDELRIRDHAEERTITLRKHGFGDAVVWNPWALKAAEVGDLGADQFPRFLCVEAAQAAAPVRLEPGGRWEGGQVVSVDR